jgi:hypothetical protein
MPDSSRVSRRSALQLGAGLLTIPLAGCGSSGSGTEPTANELGVELSLPDRIEAWSEYEIRFDSEENLEDNRVNIEIIPPDYPSGKDVTTFQPGDTWIPDPGRHRYVVYTGTRQSSENVSGRIKVLPKTPDALDREQFYKFYTELLDERYSTDYNNMINHFFNYHHNTGGYSSDAMRIFESLAYIIEETDVAGITFIKSLAYITQDSRSISPKTIQYIDTIDDSPAEYAEAFLEDAVGSTVEGKPIPSFLKRLYNFQPILYSGVRIDRSLADERSDLKQSLATVSENLHKEGSITQMDIDYLRSYLNIISHQWTPHKPRWKMAKELVEPHSKDGRITQEDLAALQSVRSSEPPVDRFSDNIKRNFFGLSSKQDIILLEAEYTKAVEKDAMKSDLQGALNVFYRETGITIVSPQRTQRPESFVGEDNYESKKFEQVDSRSGKGTHLLTFDKNTIETMVNGDIAPGVAYGYTDAPFTIVEGGPGTILHELGHIFGISGDDLPWVDEENVTSGQSKGLVTASNSRMSYDETDHDVFVGEDLKKMRESQYNQTSMSMTTIERWEAEDRTVTEVYDSVLTPDQVNLTLAPD